MQPNTSRKSVFLLSLAFGLLVAGCANKPHRAPVEDRMGSAPSVSPAPVAAKTVPAPQESKPKVEPGMENLGKPGYYQVKPGDTLLRIALEAGQNWRDLVKWNNLENPNLIEVGQVLRVLPPGVDAAGVSARPIGAAKVESRPLDGKGSAPPVAVASAASAPAPAPAASAAAGSDEDLSWDWPSASPVVAGFDEAKNNGLMFGGKAGDPVLAAADGRVMYSGSGLRGYGNLVIIKHNATYLTAYAHNQVLLVKEDQPVRKGQKIAEMGSSDADRVKLHFEVRKQGKPIDPMKVLPGR